MQVLLRPATATDAAACGRICYEAFSTVAKAYGFPMDWRSEEAAVKVIEARLAHRFTYGVVAEVGGKIAGSAFLKEYRPVGAIGPVTVTTRLQGDDIGRLMMEHLLERARTEGITGTRLVQAAYNMHSLALYTKLGFQVRDLLACLHGEPISMRMRGYPVHLGTEDDLPACDALCTRLHGYARTEDLLEALPLRTLTVVTRDGRACGYSTGAHFRGHTVAETNEDVDRGGRAVSGTRAADAGREWGVAALGSGPRPADHAAALAHDAGLLPAAGGGVPAIDPRLSRLVLLWFPLVVRSRAVFA